MSQPFPTHALTFPGATESAHFGKRDFRVGSKIFMTLPEDGLAVLKFTPEQQQMMMALYPDEVAPVGNAWGLKGWTEVRIAGLGEEVARHLIAAAWENVAPKRSRQPK